MPGCFSALENQIIIYLLNSDTMVESTVHTESNTLILIKPLNSSGTEPREGSRVAQQKWQHQAALGPPTGSAL